MPRGKTDQERGYVGAWMRRERLARSWTQKEVSARMRELGYGVTDEYYRQMESGPRKPGPDFIEVLVRLYGTEPQPLAQAEPEPQGDQAVATAIREQTQMLREFLTLQTEVAQLRHEVIRLTAELAVIRTHDQHAIPGDGNHQQ